MAMSVIGVFNYIYGAGNQPNREIQFSRKGNAASSIQARVFAAGGGSPIGTIPGNQIEVELENTTAKVRTMVLGSGLPSFTLSSLTPEQQNAIMNSLTNGTRSVEVINGRGSPGGLERVKGLIIN